MMHERYGVAYKDWIRMGHEERSKVTRGEWPMGKRSEKQDVPPDAEQSAALARRQVSELEELAAGFEVQTQEDLEAAAAFLVEVKSAWKKVEAQRKKITKPLDEAKKAAQALFKPALDRLAGLEAEIKALISAHADREAERNRELMADVPENSGALAQVTHLADVQGVQTRDHWRFEVQNADSVPRSLCSPDPAKIREFMHECLRNDVDPEVKGVAFIRETIVVSRPSK